MFQQGTGYPLLCRDGVDGEYGDDGDDGDDDGDGATNTLKVPDRCQGLPGQYSVINSLNPTNNPKERTLMLAPLLTFLSVL